MIENPADWIALAQRVDSGELYIEPGIARACAKRCADFVVELGALRTRAIDLSDISGFGTLPSGRALAEKFGKKAAGGDYSMVQALTDHIAAVERMRALFEKIDARFSATDNDTALKFGTIEHV